MVIARYNPQQLNSHLIRFDDELESDVRMTLETALVALKCTFLAMFN